MGITEYLRTCRELSELTTQNGWIDNDTLRYEVVTRDERSLTASVHFEEVLMEGSGCPAGRVACWGRVRLDLDRDGGVRRAEIL
ncbi:MAG: hypothetical protein GWO02_06055 [Gammaproteobacteria bacterium]|nr:hypothetical protein [Gammaproteobacteria bacterium]